MFQWGQLNLKEQILDCKGLLWPSRGTAAGGKQDRREYEAAVTAHCGQGHSQKDWYRAL